LSGTRAYWRFDSPSGRPMCKTRFPMGELADGTEQDLPIGSGVIEVLGRASGVTLVFASEKEEPLLGVTVLESTGLWLDPQHERLIPRLPKRKRGAK
jgi:hypothetical protein